VDDKKIVYEGRIMRVVATTKPDGRVLETMIRPPGTRIIVHRLADDNILLTREIRLDIGEDIRLPGGKVVDTIAEWDKIKDSPELSKLVIEAGARELREETGLTTTDLKLFSVATSGAPTVGHDMYYLVTNEVGEMNEQNLMEDEKITTMWTPIKEVIEICLAGKMREGRSVAAVLQYLRSVGRI
jgi:8-oxo-dGTP pyrophosphatase MutT (NUDIX family)